MRKPQEHEYLFYPFGCLVNYFIRLIDLLVQQHSNWKFFIQFVLGLLISSDIAVLSAHVIRFVNDYTTQPQLGFNFETFKIYWNGSMPGIAIEIGVLSFCLFMILLIYSRGAESDKKERKGLLKSINNTNQILANLPKEIAKVFIKREENKIRRGKRRKGSRGGKKK